ncbi:hypothetical protein ACF0H5_023616 [Mactra antiquata]
MATCMDLGYYTVMPDMSYWLSRHQVKRYLDLVQYENSNYTFWTGVYRPYDHVKTWYENWQISGCVQFQVRHYPQGNSTDGLCAVIRRTSNISRETTHKEECSNVHPFVCLRTESSLIYEEFEGFHVDNLTLDTAHLTSSDDINMTAAGINGTFFEQCSEYCAHWATCNGFTYNTTNSSTAECIFIWGSDYQYNISSMPNMTHYAKSKCNVSWHNETIQPNTNLTFASFSDCNVDEVPASYRTCVSGCPVPDLVSELIANLTIEKEGTGKYQRRYNCAKDDRPRSKTLGAFGIILVILFLSLFPMLDEMVPSGKVIRKMEKKRKKKKKEQNN